MGKKVLAAKSGRAVCPNAAAGGGIGAKNAKGAKSFLTGLTGFTGLREASVKTAKTKPSGVAWIGDIPDGWEVRRLKSIFEYRKGLSITKADLTQTGIPVISYGQIHSKENTGTHLQDSLLRFVPLKYLESDGNCLLKEDDFVFADTSEDLEGLGNCVYVDRPDKIFAGYHTIIFRPYGHYRGEVKFRYLAYLFKTDVWRSQFRAKAFGIKVYSLSQRLLNDCCLILPPLSVQRAIAAYLDEKCGAIDAAVAEAKKGIEEYKAWKKSLIFEVVTGKRRVGFFNAEKQSSREAESFSTGLTRFTGLGENLDNPVNPVKTKPSGIPWIGDVPVGWEVCRVKDVAKIKTGNTPDKQYQREYYSTDGGVPWIKAENLGFMSPISQTAEYLTKEGCKQGRIFQPRTVYVCCIASIGKVGYSEIEASCNQQLNALAFNSRMHWKYGFYVTIASEEEYLVRASGNVVKILNSSEQGLMALPLPSIAEQRAIADYLDDKCAAIDKMVAEKNALIADLEAYKKSLIYEVVTGKREVASTIEVK